VTRTVTRNGDVYIQDTIETHYLPWQAKFEYGQGRTYPRLLLNVSLRPLIRVFLP